MLKSHFPGLLDCLYCFTARLIRGRHDRDIYRGANSAGLTAHSGRSTTAHRLGENSITLVRRHRTAADCGRLIDNGI